jgi:uncharacterized Ntn-hydrolase superfamily protein
VIAVRPCPRAQLEPEIRIHRVSVRAVTYTILARDSATGDLGVAVASRYLAVGASVPWAQARIGAVATQALTQSSYGPRILDRLSARLPVESVLDAALAEDPQRELRQVGVIDRHGATAVHTGGGCIPYSEHVREDGMVTMGNLLSRQGTAVAMAAAFRDGSGSFATRMVQALVAGQAHGGDLRGQQSAALLVVSDRGTGAGTNLRVDDHTDPLGELARLLEMHRVYQRLGKGINRLFAGESESADAEISEALAAKQDSQIEFWHRIAAGLPVADLGQQWQELERRLRESGRLPME